MTYRGRGCYSQIHGFEDEIGSVCKLDNLTTHETEFLIIIQHSVHVLNPDSINRTIKYQPLSIGGLAREAKV